MEHGSKKEASVTFLGHACMLIRIGDTHILTDPNFSRRIAFIIRRRNKLPISVRELPPIDVVLVSHGHYDHLDLPTLRQLPKTPTIVVPPGLEPVVKPYADRVVTLSPWEQHREKDAAITAVPAKHFPGRSPLRRKTGYQGYVVEGSAVIYFAGDTGMFDGLSEIGRKWNIDAALLPVGAYEPPRFRRHHMTPEDAVQAARSLGAKQLVPIHWGSFKLSLEPFHEPIPRLLQAADEAKLKEIVQVLQPGETLAVGE